MLLNIFILVFFTTTFLIQK